MGLFQRSVAPLVLKFGIHQEQAWRKRVRRGEEEGMSREVDTDSQCSWRFHHLPRLGSSILSPCENQSKDYKRSPLMYLNATKAEFVQLEKEGIVSHFSGSWASPITYWCPKKRWKMEAQWGLLLGS
jgi:hypothetical protein